VLPLLVAASTQLDVWPSPLNLGHVEGPRPILASLYAVTSLALVWRRRAALSVLAFVTLADVAYYLAYGAPEGLGSVIPALVAWYAVGRYGPARQFVPGTALVVVGIAAHELRDPAFRFGGLEVVLWAVVAAGWPVGYAFAQRAREARELVDSREEMARRAVSEERARIARELHDVVGHGISVAVLQMVAAVSLLENGATEPARVRLLNAERSAREALAVMRRLLGLMDSSPDAALAPQPGLNQLDKLIEDTRSAGATLHVAFEGEPVALPAGLDLAAFRIVQEALTNVLKHASPPSADVRLVYRTDRLDIEVRDHGGPGSTDGISEGGGRGLAGMRERARIYDGGLHAGRCEDGGYLVQAWLPVGTP
jgi:signal transduction histidine kinase